ncbi:MAG TPA: hypothetical protein VKZ74_08040 [Natronosporangium sp.]|nr:hypothetical protein [Natronosporangium sp.]
MTYPDEDRTVDFDDEPGLPPEHDFDDRSPQAGDEDDRRLLDERPPHWS